MQATRIFTVLFLLGLLLTIVLSDLNMDNNDLDLSDENHAISKRFLHHHHHNSDSNNPRHCVPCKFHLMRCCSPNVCVKRHLRADKCLRIKT